MIDLAPVAQTDLRGLVSVHKKAYSEAHFTSRFSPELLERYYGHFLGDQCFVTKAVPAGGAGVPVGFVVSGLGIGARIAAFKHDSRGAILGTVLRHPMAAARKVVSDLYYRLFDSVYAYQECPYLILSIASDRSLPGIGAALLKHAVETAKSIGCNAVGLYVRVSNVKAIDFYLKNGFVVKGYSSGQFYLEAATS